ncbi:transcriptional regulator [Aliidiomarina minuta]|uniref:Transcriptional regulator n=2 Tax=Aliidiomarina minuta TaxID=880057 RepID=A0A432W913_9GAMM|nr:transcriptional regulator [Aliidiomarina minuta]
MVKKLPYRLLLEAARRYARRQNEAEDIVQEVLVAAISAGRLDFSAPENRRWMMGAIKRRAAFDARSALRRRLRETHWQSDCSAAEYFPTSSPSVDIAFFLRSLPKALRVTAALAVSGHSRTEISYLLSISDAALRQRIRGIRKAFARSDIAIPENMTSLNLNLSYGAIREALRPLLRNLGGVFASHDPDGHLFIVRCSQNPRARQQESNKLSTI